MRLTFKKDPRPTGLASVGHPDPDTTVKLDGLVWGRIDAPWWGSKDRLWRFCFMTKENSSPGWRWVFVKKGFVTEPEAREAIKRSLSAILASHTPYTMP